VTDTPAFALTPEYDTPAETDVVTLCNSDYVKEFVYDYVIPVMTSLLNLF
jgi:hypothetical protein